MDSRDLTHRLADRIDVGAGEPVAQLIVEEVWLAVVEGGLETGQRLPTARRLAVALGVSPRTVEWAYRELERRGVVATRRGEGTFVSLDPPPEEERTRHRLFARLCGDTVERARDLGFGIDDLLDALAQYRGVDR
ncbi:MAG: GntR family transcriptional regulator [Gemmatimonadota bacterium]